MKVYINYRILEQISCLGEILVVKIWFKMLLANQHAEFLNQISLEKNDEKA